MRGDAEAGPALSRSRRVDVVEGQRVALNPPLLSHESEVITPALHNMDRTLQIRGRRKR